MESLHGRTKATQNDAESAVIPYRESLFHYHGYPCAVVLTPNGCRCGYVCLTNRSRYYGKHYDEIPIQCHGGLTYASDELLSVKSSGVSRGNTWWIGFDCAHFRDANDYPAVYAAYANDPETIRRMKVLEAIEEGLAIKGEVRTLEYVEKECRGIVNQLIDLEAEHEDHGRQEKLDMHDLPELPQAERTRGDP